MTLEIVCAGLHEKTTAHGRDIYRLALQHLGRSYGTLFFLYILFFQVFYNRCHVHAGWSYIVALVGGFESDQSLTCLCSSFQ